MAELIGTATAEKNGLVRAGNLSKYIIKDNQKYIKLSTITSCSFLVTKNQGGMAFFSFFAYGKTSAQKIVNVNFNISAYYDNTNHILYISADNDSELYILDFSQTLRFSYTNEDPTSYTKIL